MLAGWGVPITMPTHEPHRNVTLSMVKSQITPVVIEVRVGVVGRGSLVNYLTSASCIRCQV